MEIKIEYCDGSIAVLEHVRRIELLSIGPVLLVGSTFRISCFGNGFADHKYVINLDIVGW
jgi:hypothetical protein